MRKDLEQMNLLDDFLFGAMINDERYGEKLSRCILETVFQRPMGNLTVHAQTVFIGAGPKNHGIRLDAYIEEKNEDVSVFAGDVYDIEPHQKEGERNTLPKRARYYHTLRDSRLLKTGDDYSDLKEAFVIVITPYDPLGSGRMVYTIRNMCVEDPSIPYYDGAVTMFLYTDGDPETGSEELGKLLKYMKNTTEANAVGDDLREIQRMVKEIKQNKEVRTAAMKYNEILKEERSEGKEEGLKEGLKEGKEEGRVEGGFEMLFALVRKKLISVKDAAEQVGIPEDDFCKKMNSELKA